jgi:hypothetical protein
MSLMSWLFPSRKRSKAPPTSMMPSGHGAQRKSRDAGSGGSSGKRKADRSARRELLYAVVREAMVRAGVLSASYKFKVLSLDAEGRQFLIMVDLEHGAGGDPAHLAEIEALIAQAAKARHKMEVTAVYWRVNQQAAAGHIEQRRSKRAVAPDSQPADSVPAALHSVPGALAPPPSTRGPAYEPIQADEVEAFKRALVAGSRPAPLAAVPEANVALGADGRPHHGPRSYTLLTGFEDTEMPDAEQKTQLLSGTQYGELR